MKKVLSILIIVTMIIAGVFLLTGCGEKEDIPMPNNNDSQQQESEKSNNNKKEPIVPKIGDEINYGSYLGYPIKWQTLAVDTENEKALLIANEIIAYWAFSENAEDTIWETSEMRKWLNNDLYNTSFSEEQKSIILESILKNSANSESNVGSGTDTKDKVFLLSEEEVKMYLSKENDRIVEFNPSQTYLQNLAETISNHTSFGYTKEEVLNQLQNYVGTTDWWWLRTSGNSLTRVASVGYDGSLYLTGNQANKVWGGVRPAIWIDISIEE